MKVFREKLAHPTSESLRLLLGQYFPRRLFTVLDGAESRDEKARLVQLFLSTFEGTARVYECWQTASTVDLQRSTDTLAGIITREKFQSELFQVVV